LLVDCTSCSGYLTAQSTSRSENVKRKGVGKKPVSKLTQKRYREPLNYKKKSASSPI